VFVLWRTRCNHDVALLIPMAARCARHVLFRSGAQALSSSRWTSRGGPRRSAKNGSYSGVAGGIPRFGQPTTDVPTHSPQGRAIFSGRSRARDRAMRAQSDPGRLGFIAACPLIRHAWPANTHVLGLFPAMRDEKASLGSKSRVARRIKNNMARSYNR